MLFNTFIFIVVYMPIFKDLFGANYRPLSLLEWNSHHPIRLISFVSAPSNRAPGEGSRPITIEYTKFIDKRGGKYFTSNIAVIVVLLLLLLTQWPAYARYKILRHRNEKANSKLMVLSQVIRLLPVVVVNISSSSKLRLASLYSLEGGYKNRFVCKSFLIS